MKTREEVLKHYIDGESESPIVRFMRMTTPKRDIDITGKTPTDKRVQAYLDAEEAKTHNPIIDLYK